MKKGLFHFFIYTISNNTNIQTKLTISKPTDKIKSGFAKYQPMPYLSNINKKGKSKILEYSLRHILLTNVKIY